MEIIAFYLPQYHPTPHNNEWWGEGFTEWTNVAKAKRLYRGHYQPHIPADLGFYDLRVPEVREQQVKLAKEAGITGFCYYHYWFGNGEVELHEPLEAVIESGNPDFPICLCWANETWGKKMWNPDGSIAERIVLAEQKYLGEKDNIDHFNYLLKTFKDKRYIKVKGKLLFLIYKPLDFINLKEFMSQWQNLAQDNGLPGFYFVGYSSNIKEEYSSLNKLGLDSIVVCNLAEPMYHGKHRSFLNKAFVHLKRMILRRPTVIEYRSAIKYFQSPYDKDSNIYPTLIPNWDHTPRSGRGGYVFNNATPDLFQQHAYTMIESVKHKDVEDQILFLKSWNEWGEGNYMEPDLKYGKGFITALKKAIKESNC